MQTIESTLSIMPATKDEVAAFVAKFKEEMESGYSDPIKTLRNLKAIEAALEQMIKIAMPYALDEAQKNGKSFQQYGAKFEVKEVGVKYDYSHTNDTIYASLATKQAQIKEQMKQRETFLKSISGQQVVIDEETGDVVTLYPPQKTSTTSVAVTLL
jgi:hypothetical protein